MAALDTHPLFLLVVPVSPVNGKKLHGFVN